MLSEIPESAFTEIEEELNRRPLQTNKYRKKVGDGKSQCFGLVGRRCLPIDYSRQCWKRPYLYKLLLDFGEKYVTDISWNAITVNQNFKCQPHRDLHNIGDSFLVGFGPYIEGKLKIHEGDLSGEWDIRHKPIITDFTKVLHYVLQFGGDRYSLVYYQLKTDTIYPAPSVRFENNQYVFYRGDIAITDGLAHPLKGRKKVSAEIIK